MATMSGSMRIEERAAQPVVFVRTATPERFDGLIGEGIRAVSAFLEARGVTPAGPPYGRSTWEPGSPLEVGFPVSEAVVGDGVVTNGALPAGRMAVALHRGPHDAIPTTRDALSRWIAAEGLDAAGTGWEVYLTNPAQEPDPAKWRNELIQPVREAPATR